MSGCFWCLVRAYIRNRNVTKPTGIAIIQKYLRMVSEELLNLSPRDDSRVAVVVRAGKSCKVHTKVSLVLSQSNDSG